MKKKRKPIKPKTDKIIIHNEAGLAWDLAIDAVSKVVDMGQVSEGTYGRQFSFASDVSPHTLVFVQKNKSGSQAFRLVKRNG